MFYNQWTNASEKILVVVNFADGSGYGLIKLSDASSG